MISFIIMIGIQIVAWIIIGIVGYSNKFEMSFHLIVFAMILLFVYFFIIMLTYQAKVFNEKSKNLEDLGTAV